MLYQVAIMAFAAVFSSTILAYLLLRNRLSKQARQIRKRLESISTLSDSEEQQIQQLAIRDVRLSKIPAIDRILAKFRFVDNLSRLIKQAGLQINAGVLLLSMLSLAGLTFLIVFHITDASLAALGSAVVGGMLPYLYLQRKKKKRIEQFETQLPEALDMTKDALKAGFSFESALTMVAQEMPDPLGIEFAITFEEQNLGVSLAEALANLRERVPSEDLDLFITALMIQKRTGGNLAEILQKAGSTIRARVKFQQAIKSKTAQGRFSGIILVLLPVALGAAIMVLNPDYILTLFRDKIGNYLLGITVFMQILGILVIKRIINIKV